MFRPAPAKHTLGALAGLGPRLPVGVAEAVLSIVEPLVPRRMGTYRFIDEEIVAVLAAVARSPQDDLARRAEAALVDAVGHHVQRAADAVVSVGRDLPGLAVRALAVAPGGG